MSCTVLWWNGMYMIHYGVSCDMSDNASENGRKGLRQSSPCTNMYAYMMHVHDHACIVHACIFFRCGLGLVDTQEGGDGGVCWSRCLGDFPCGDLDLCNFCGLVDFSCRRALRRKGHGMKTNRVEEAASPMPFLRSFSCTANPSFSQPTKACLQGSIAMLALFYPEEAPFCGSGA